MKNPKPKRNCRMHLTEFTKMLMRNLPEQALPEAAFVKEWSGRLPGSTSPKLLTVGACTKTDIPFPAAQGFLTALIE